MSRAAYLTLAFAAPLALAGYLLADRVGEVADQKARQVGHLIAPGASFHCNAPLADWQIAYDAAPDDAKPAPPLIDDEACRAEQFALAERAGVMITALDQTAPRRAARLRELCENWNDPATVRAGYAGVIDCYRREGARLGVTWGGT